MSCTGLRRPAATAPVQQPEKEVSVLEDQWMAAMVSRDTAVLSAILAPQFILNGSNGAESRSEYLQTAAMPERTLQPIVLTDRHHTAYEQTVISYGRATYAGHWKGNAFRLPVRYTNVFVRLNGRWQAAAAHLTVVQ